MDAPRPDEMHPINVDIALAISRSLGVLPAVDRNRAAIVRDCPTVDVALIDQIDERADAGRAGRRRWVVG